MKDKEAKNNIKLRKLEQSIEFEKRYVIEPIIAFLETDLNLMSIIYGKAFDKEPLPIKKYLSEHINQLAITEARIKVYGDEYLEKKFSEFSVKRLEIGNRIYDEHLKDIKSAFEQLKEAIDLASEVIKMLKQKLRDNET